ncbi:MAG: phosphogluconate dehydratase, partial [Planctomycetota bacterium]
MNNTVLEVTRRVVERSSAFRKEYLEQMKTAKIAGVNRMHLSCGNLAHAFAGC